MGRETRGREGERKRKRERETTNPEGEGERWTRGWKGGDGGATTRLRAADGYREVRGGGEYVDSPEGRGVIEATSLEGRAGEGRQRIGSRGKLAAGNSRLDSTRLNSPVLLLLVLSLFRSHRRSPFSPSLANTQRVLVYRSTIQAPPCRSSCTHRRVYTGWCLFARSTASPRRFNVVQRSSFPRNLANLCLSRGIFHLRRSFTPTRVGIAHTYENGEM